MEMNYFVFLLQSALKLMRIKLKKIKKKKSGKKVNEKCLNVDFKSQYESRLLKKNIAKH